MGIPVDFIDVQHLQVLARSLTNCVISKLYGQDASIFLNAERLLWQQDYGLEGSYMLLRRPLRSGSHVLSFPPLKIGSLTSDPMQPTIDALK